MTRTTMERRHFELIARTIRTERDSPHNDMATVRAIDRIALAFEAALADTNTRFNHERVGIWHHDHARPPRKPAGAL